MEIHKVSPPTVNFIVINITFSVTSAINVAAMARKTQDTINSDTHTHTHTAEIQLIHTSRQRFYLIACLPLLLFHSLCLTHTNTSGDAMT